MVLPFTLSRLECRPIWRPAAAFLRADFGAMRVNTATCCLFLAYFAGTFLPSRRSILRHYKENVMNSIVWLVGAVVIVIAVLNLVGFA